MIPAPKSLDHFILSSGISRSLLRSAHFLLFEFGALAVDNYELALYSGIPFFVYFRGFDASLMLNNLEYRKKLARLLSHSSSVFSVSPHLLDNLQRHGLSATSSHVIPSSVEPIAYIPCEHKDSNLFVSIGRMVEKKGHEFTIRAFSNFLQSSPPGYPRLVMIGGGPQFDYIHKICRSLGIAEHVDFMGAINNKLALSLLRKATFYIQSSVTAQNGDSEGFPSAIQEAMMHSCVVITSCHGGVKHYLKHNINALISQEEEVLGMSFNMRAVFADSALRARLSIAAHETALKEMNIEINIAKLETIINASLESQLSTLS